MAGKVDKTLETIKFVLSKKKYLFISVVSGVLVFVGLYYLIVAKIADNSLRIAIMMSGQGYITEALTSIFLISAFFGIHLGLMVFKFDSFKRVERKGVFGFIGSGIGALGAGCPTCGAFLFGLVGAPLAFMYLPFRGAELRIASVIILAVSIYFTSKSIKGVCEVS